MSLPALEGDTCPECLHPALLHVVFPMYGTPGRGICLCPVGGCECYLTFGMGLDDPPPFSRSEVRSLRTAIQTGET